MKNLPIILIAAVGFWLLFASSSDLEPSPTPVPDPIGDLDILSEADNAYRAKLALLVQQYSGSDWTTETKKSWSSDVSNARSETHSVVSDRLAQAFSEGSAAGLVEPIQKGTWQ